MGLRKPCPVGLVMWICDGLSPKAASKAVLDHLQKFRRWYTDGRGFTAEHFQCLLCLLADFQCHSAGPCHQNVDLAGRLH